MLTTAIMFISTEDHNSQHVWKRVDTYNEELAMCDAIKNAIKTRLRLEERAEKNKDNKN